MEFKSTLPGDITPYKVGGLIFPSKSRFEEFEEIDRGCKKIILDFNYEKYLQDFFNKIRPIKVIESYPYAREELDGLFPNILGLLTYELYGTRNTREKCKKFSDKFFSKFEYIEP